jgi:hypothetical protein
MVVVGESNKDAFVEFLCIHHNTEIWNDRQHSLQPSQARGPPQYEEDSGEDARLRCPAHRGPQQEDQAVGVA